MTNTKDERNIFQRIAAAMGEVKYVQKNKPKGMQYSVVSHDNVTAKVRPALLKHGVIYFPSVLEHGQDGNRTWAKVETRFQNIDDPKDFIAIQMFGYGVDSQDKGPGKAISYAVKYCLLKAMGLETGDDADNESIDHEPPKTPDDIKKEIWAVIKENELELEIVQEKCERIFSTTIKDADIATLEGLLESITNSPDMYRHYEANEQQEL